MHFIEHALRLFEKLMEKCVREFLNTNEANIYKVSFENLSGFIFSEAKRNFQGIFHLENFYKNVLKIDHSLNRLALTTVIIQWQK